jgi:hypothetical protein
MWGARCFCKRVFDVAQRGATKPALGRDQRKAFGAGAFALAPNQECFFSSSRSL